MDFDLYVRYAFYLIKRVLKLCISLFEGDKKLNILSRVRRLVVRCSPVGVADWRDAVQRD